MARIAFVRVAIVDVGANTLRLLVATREEGRLVAVREQRVQLSLGEDIEHSGRIGELKLAEAAAIALEGQGVGGPRRHRLVPAEDPEFSCQEALHDLRKVEGRGLTARSTPEVRRDTDHPLHVWQGRVAAALRAAKVSITVHEPVDIPVT